VGRGIIFSMAYFFDSYAIIEIVKGNQNYQRFQAEGFITNTLNLAEVYYSILRETNEKTADYIIKSLNLSFVDIKQDTAIKAALFKYRTNKKMSYADCIGYISASKNNLIFLTGDKLFENLNNVEFVK